MGLSEFDAIRRFFSAETLSPTRADIPIGIGDDAAVLRIATGQELVVAADTLVEGVHFPVAAPADHIGYRSLAVNLSDLAAMGAEPNWYTLCLTVPELRPRWLQDFARGLAAAAVDTGICLVGGDTTRGPLTISVQIMGLVEAGSALTRDGARPGDLVYVTGTLGDAAAGLAQLQREPAGGASFDRLIERFWRPTARLREADILRGLASSCIDISDGLVADLGHICQRSGVAARINRDLIPLSTELKALGSQQAFTYALSGGDDYELCFTVPESAAQLVERDFGRQGLVCSCIGQVIEGQGVQCLDAGGETIEIHRSGYEHFSE